MGKISGDLFNIPLLKKRNIKTGDVMINYYHNNQ